MFNRFLAIARISFLETVGQPIYGILLLCTALMLVFNVSLAAFTLTDDNKLLLELGLSTLLLSGLFAATFSAAGVISREIENKTAVTVISKPVGRSSFLVAKFFGLLAAMILAHYLNTLVFLFAQRHGVLQNASDPWDMPVLVFGSGAIGLSLLAAAFVNYFYGKSFPLAALVIVTPALTLAYVAVGFWDAKWNPISFGSDYPGGQVVIATFLVLLFNIMLGALATAASTRLGQLMTLVTCVLFVCLAVISDYAVGQHAAQSWLASVGYHFIPNLSPFWVIDGLFADNDAAVVTGEYLLHALAYSGLVSVALLSVGVILFHKREVG